MHNSRPIGIFDSGIGGLTLASQLSKLLPGEDLIYFGDTAHLPYGDKSTAAIQAYSVKISQFLLDRGVKAILIACNSASAAAYELVKEYVGTKAMVFNVIDPVVDFLSVQYPGEKIGLIGTKQTVNSGIFAKKLAESGSGIDLSSLATPLLAPMIEEGFFNNKISLSIIEEYLRNPVLNDISAIVLACTHYPLIASQIAGFYQEKVAIVDSSRIVASQVKESLAGAGLLNTQAEGKKVFYVSDFTAAFENATQIFFGNKLHLEHFPLWD
jgi:glutamate racemase